MERKEAIKYVKTHLLDEKYNIEALTTLIPELKESEDEIVRKDIISFLHSKNGYMNLDEDWEFHNRWLPWLEKQGESIDKEKVKIGARKDLALSIINYLDDNRAEGCMNLSSMECEDIEDACVNSKWTKLYNYMKKKLETPDVSDYNPYEATVKSIIAMTERYANGNDLRDFYDNVKVKCKEAVDYDKTWLEKTSKQSKQDNSNVKDYNSIDPYFGKNIEIKPTWSEDDEIGLDDALWCCKQAASIAKDENDMGNAWYAENWLKSIKDRIGSGLICTVKDDESDDEQESTDICNFTR